MNRNNDMAYTLYPACDPVTLAAARRGRVLAVASARVASTFLDYARAAAPDVALGSREVWAGPGCTLWYVIERDEPRDDAD